MPSLIKIFLKSFLHTFLIVFFILFLYLIGRVMAQPLLLMNFEKEKLSLIGTIFTFFIFIFLLPYWFKIRWNITNTWTKLGINKKNFLGNISQFSKGILFSLVLISLILFPILNSDYIDWTGELTPEVLRQSIFYILCLGFAEELFFRAWLFEELKLQYGIKIALIGQALVYSFVHYISDTSFLNIIGLRLGWFLLGILLNLIRIKDRGSLWKCIGIHGGLVGIWYFSNSWTFY